MGCLSIKMSRISIPRSVYLLNLLKNLSWQDLINQWESNFLSKSVSFMRLLLLSLFELENSTAEIHYNHMSQNLFCVPTIFSRDRLYLLHIAQWIYWHIMSESGQYSDGVRSVQPETKWSILSGRKPQTPHSGLTSVFRMLCW